MPRPPALAAEEKAHIVLAVLAGQIGPTAAARRSGVSEQTVSNWRRQFVAGGRAALAGAVPRPGPGPAVGAELARLREALASAELRATVWERAAASQLPPVEELEQIRVRSALPVSRFCAVIGVPRRTYTRWLSVRLGSRCRSAGAGRR